MKLIKLTSLLTLSLALSILTGCHGKNYHPTTNIPGLKPHGVGDDTGPGKGNLIDQGPAITDNNLGNNNNTTGISLGDAKHTGWPEDRETLRADIVYFDFDSSVIKENQKSKVQAVADYMKKESVNAVKVEGHCDERGTEEYNRALGEHRALAIREALVGMGISPDRVDTITYGEDKPAAVGNNEAAWSKNRRGEFIVLTPPK